MVLISIMTEGKSGDTEQKEEQNANNTDENKERKAVRQERITTNKDAMDRK